MKFSPNYTLSKKALLLCCLIIVGSSLFANGLRFKGSEFLIDERTSYDVFGNNSPEFTGKLNVSFNISLLEPSHYGYIVRIKSEAANKTYNLSYYTSGNTALFKFNEEGGKNLITIKLNNAELQQTYWFKIDIDFDLKKQNLNLTINNHTIQVNNVVVAPKWKPEIYFGRSDYLIDVPSFAIRQLSVNDSSNYYVFPLSESKGDIVHDLNGKEYGKVVNPIWLINDAYYWNYKQGIKSGSVAGCNFDPKTDNLYIFNKDSLITYNVRTGNINAEALTQECPVDIFLGTNFLDSNEQRLYVYEVCNEKNIRSLNVAYLDLNTKRWNALSYSSVYMQLHHHSSYFDSDKKRFYVFGGFGGFGGFGNMQYSKSLFSYNFNVNRWDSLTLGGDKINPRYFSSMGYKPDLNSLYIFGGMGNESGEQIVGRQYFYDLYRINLKNNQVSKLWKIQWNKENVVPVRQMIMSDSCFYTLCYPEHFSKTFLKLYQFSLKDGSFKVLGDSIPMRSEKIKTKANIYYSTNQNTLYAIVQEFDNFDISSTIKVYSLSFPPISYEELTSHDFLSKQSYILTIMIIIFVVVIFAGLIIIYIRRRRKRLIENLETEYLNLDEEEKTDIGLSEKIEKRPNSIYLFGEFSVHDRKSRDITYMFSSKLKQAFLLILHYSADAGVSSQKLSEMLWPDKPEDKVKNSRGVTINHLRKIMKELDGIELIFDKGLFRIVIDTEVCYCDYSYFWELIKSDSVENNLSDFIEIIRHGKFLKSIESPDFDPFKEEVERNLEPALILEAEKCFNKELYKVTIILCEALFNIDPINEDALYYSLHAMKRMRMSNELKKLYLQFTTEYHRMQGKEYTIALSDLLIDKKR